MSQHCHKVNNTLLLFRTKLDLNHETQTPLPYKHNKPALKIHYTPCFFLVLKNFVSLFENPQDLHLFLFLDQPLFAEFQMTTMLFVIIQMGKARNSKYYRESISTFS